MTEDGAKPSTWLGLSFLFLILGSPLIAQATDDVAVPFIVSTRNDVVLFMGVGLADYTEDVSIDPATSDWSAPYAEFGAVWVYRDPTKYKLRLRGEYWDSDDDTEEWSVDGGVVQRNSLQISGFDVSAEFGYGFAGSTGKTLDTWIGLAYRRQDFDRSRFRLTMDEDPAQDSSVEESYDIGLVSVSADFAIPLGARWEVAGLANVGFVFSNEADNGLFGTVKGDGGTVIELAAMAEYHVTPEQSVGLGLRYDFQQLDGDAVNSVIIVEDTLFQSVTEWPDNELQRISLDAYWRVRI